MGVRIDGKTISSVSHEDLAGLLGGDSTGHYHVVSGFITMFVSGVAGIIKVDHIKEYTSGHGIITDHSIDTHDAASDAIGNNLKTLIMVYGG